MDTVWEALGWIGSILVVWSLMQARMLRFRWMNLAGSLLATVYNTIFEIWPFVAMNGAIVLINAYWILRLTRERHDPGVYQVLSVSPEDPFLQHFLKVHAADIAAHRPDFAARTLASGGRRATYLVTRGDEAVGVVALRDEGGGVGLVELDWVKPRFRDFTPGEFVYRDSGALTSEGFRRVEIETRPELDREYLRNVGFSTQGTRWVREL
ncbi:YgjV family protein [Demequina mangrovi]|uniref:Inner membrane protein n=1 Tax=Demequina mangrovi TaxID=1043493 RepID=A0A1H7AJ29_9MICO|nr:YgjV family protein [Demequina mangrovi]SEJ65599.1 inner membrane protein [Demequina mangrovi]